MHIFDKNWKKNYKAYLFQSFLALICTFFILIALGTIAEAAIVASIGSSIFIVFAIPHSRTAFRRNLMGGYLVGTGCGLFFSFLLFQFRPQVHFVSEDILMIIFASLAVGFSIFFMAITDTEHPPAAGIALGFTIQNYNEWTILFVMGSGLILTWIRNILLPRMRNLL